MRNSLIKLQYVLFALSLFALAACGVNDKSVSSDLTGNGSVTAKIAWPDGKTSAKSAALVADIVNVQLIVTGPAIPTAKGTPVAKGSNPSVEVYPGNDLIVAAYALDATGNRIYEGFVTGVTVAAGPATDVGTIKLTPVVVKAADTNCISCHEATRVITGQNLVTDYKQSGHYTNTSWTANAKNGSATTGCAGCHGTQHQDLAPSASGRCFECHGANLSLKHTSTSALIAGEANPARYLNLTGTNCSACHEPHNPINGAGKLQRTQWEASGHGDIAAPPWAHYDFTTRDVCNSCHTAEGFAKAVGNNFTNKAAFSTTMTRGKQPLTCDGCHSSNDFKNSVRSLSAAYVTPYAASTVASNTFPDKAFVGNSNICFPCHAGLNGGKNVENTTLNLAATTFGSFNSHYMAAAGVMYVKNGFTAFTSASAPVKVSGVAASTSASTNVPLFTSAGAFKNYTSIPKGYVFTYGNSLTSSADGGAIGSTHRILGTPAMANDSHTLGRDLLKGGPCVTCHMGNADHTWGINANSFNTACYKCHSTEGTTTLTAANFKTVFVEEQAVPFQNALTVAKYYLNQKYGIDYDQASYPYFWIAGSTDHIASANQFKDWTKGGALTTVQAKKLVGACFNINLLSREPAAYVHARTYVRRLLYDTIDFLDNGTMDMSVTTSAAAVPTIGTLYTLTPDASTASTSLSYLKAYNRTGNAWYPSERP